MRILLTGGGSGGHVYPLIAVARNLRKTYGDANVSFQYIGPRGPRMEIERSDFAAEKIPSKFVSAGKMRRYFDVKNFTDPFVTIWGIIQSLYLLVKDMPDAVFAKGGFGALPVVIVARIYFIPVLIHESDAVPGVANRVMGKLARRVAITYAHAEQYFQSRKVVLTGIPVRDAVVAGDANRAKEICGFHDDKPVVVVVGGSQGAKVINSAIAAALPELLPICNIIHVTGTAHYDAVVAEAGRAGVKARHDNYYTFDYVDAATMGDILSLATIVVSRAGAGTIAEIAAHQKAALLIPLHLAANDHQRMNAYEVAKAGGATVLEESNLGTSILVGNITKLLNDAQLRTAMEMAIGKFYHPNATADIASGLIEMIPPK